MSPWLVRAKVLRQIGVVSALEVSAISQCSSNAVTRTFAAASNLPQRAASVRCVRRGAPGRARQGSRVRWSVAARCRERRLFPGSRSSCQRQRSRREECPNSRSIERCYRHQVHAPARSARTGAEPLARRALLTDFARPIDKERPMSRAPHSGLAFERMAATLLVYNTGAG